MELREIISHYGALTAECMEELCRTAVLECRSGGEFFLQQGSMCRDWYFNRSGITRVVHRWGEDQKTAEDTLLFGSEGDVFTSLHSWFAGEPAAFSLIAVEYAEVYRIPYSVMRRTIALYPDMVLWLLRLCEGQIYTFERRYLKFANRSAGERLEEFLGKDRPNLERMPGKTVAQHIPLKYVASYLGIKPETLSRLRRRRGDR